jgi:hypothetical protein
MCWEFSPEMVMLFWEVLETLGGGTFLGGGKK